MRAQSARVLLIVAGRSLWGSGRLLKKAALETNTQAHALRVFFDVVIADRLVKYRLQNQRTESFFNDM